MLYILTFVYIGACVFITFREIKIQTGLHDAMPVKMKSNVLKVFVCVVLHLHMQKQMEGLLLFSVLFC